MMSSECDDPEPERRTVTLTHQEASFHRPLEVDVFVYPDGEVSVEYPPTRAFGNGATLEAALVDLADHLISLVRELEETPDAQLGPEPVQWRAHLRGLVTFGPCRESAEEGSSMHGRTR